MNTIFKALALLLTVAALGCSTPPEMLNQARNTAALTTSLGAEQREFKRVREEIAASRLKSIQRQTAALETYESSVKYDDRTRDLSGLSDDQRFYKALRELSDSRAQDAADLAAKLKALDESLASTVTPIPEAATRISALEKALLPLGEELSAQARVKEATKFAQGIQKGIEDSREKLKAAEAGTPDAPVQASAPTATAKK